MEGVREKVEINRVRIRLDRLSSPALRGHIFEVVSNSEVESAGNSLDFALCVPVLPHVVPVVTVPFSDVNVVCEVVFLGSDCEFVEP